MAEIPIQHKPRGRASVWPFIVVALVVLLLVWGVTAYKRGQMNTAAAPADTATAAGEVYRPDTALHPISTDTSLRHPPALDTTARRP